MRKGKQQVFFWGWLADYPDAENFLFLLYGPNSKAKADGENTANYENPEYDKRYKQLQLMDDGAAKQKVIDEMVTMAQQDAIWSFGYFPFASGAYQSWLYNGKPTIMIRDMAKYYRLDPAQRAAKQAQWNHPTWWPPLALTGLVMLLFGLAWRAFRRRERVNARGEVLA
jgi:ABC-type oligopeptide transport system substrate-binding subunit